MEVGGATPPLHWKHSGLVLTLMSCWVDLGCMGEEAHIMLKSRQVGYYFVCFSVKLFVCCFVMFILCLLLLFMFVVCLPAGVCPG